MKRKTVIFYGRTQVASCVLSYLVATGHSVKVIPEDELIEKLADYYALEKLPLHIGAMGEFDLFVCCHGKRIIPEDWLSKGTFINLHPCLFKYKGQNPIKQYIENKDTKASIGCHYMVKEVDAGEVIGEIFFETPVVNSYGEYFNLAIPYYYQMIHEAMKKL